MGLYIIAAFLAFFNLLAIPIGLILFRRYQIQLNSLLKRIQDLEQQRLLPEAKASSIDPESENVRSSSQEWALS